MRSEGDADASHARLDKTQGEVPGRLELCRGTLKQGIEPLHAHILIQRLTLPSPGGQLGEAPPPPRDPKRVKEVKLTRPSGPALARSDVLHLVPDL